MKSEQVIAHISTVKIISLEIIAQKFSKIREKESKSEKDRVTEKEGKRQKALDETKIF